LRRRNTNQRNAHIHYAAVDLSARKEEKYRILEELATETHVNWRSIEPDSAGNWLREGLRSEFDDFLSIGAKSDRLSPDAHTIFEVFSHGINTARDSTVYNFKESDLSVTTKKLTERYNAEIDRWIRAGKPASIDSFVDYDKLKWSRNLKRNLRNL